MSDILQSFAAAVLLTVGASLVRTFRGPTPVDRMMGAQLAGTGGTAILLLLAVASRKWAVVDVALVLALLAVFAAIGFVKATTPDGVGDPEEEDAKW